MGLSEDCDHYFGTHDFYAILDINKKANESQVKSAYRKLSLKVHPDRVDDDHKEEAKRKFQVIHKIHYILSHDETRGPYDEMGIIPDDDSMESKANWNEYWRLLFPKITTKDIDAFIAKYVDSKEEREDLKKYYLRFEGDMDKICMFLIGFEEERVTQLLLDMIDAEEVPKYDAFINETQKKRDKRKKKAEKEAKDAEKEKKNMKTHDDDDSDLVRAIQSRSKGNFDNMIAALEAKYSNGKGGQSSKGTNKKTKRK